MKYRTVDAILSARATLEGAGVRLKRVFGFGDTKRTDPFLLLDHFGSDDPDDYLAGFPWHPHRGIETVTYLIAGRVEHGDSIGNSGVIGPGDIQWMTAGRGIIHQEMPKPGEGNRMEGFQLWVNLPRSEKMTIPAYRGYEVGEIPIAKGKGYEAKVICGKFGTTEGAVRGVKGNPEYVDVTLEPSAAFDLPVAAGSTAIAYVYAGTVKVRGGAKGGTAHETEIGAGNAVLFSDGDAAGLTAGYEGGQFLFIQGRPLREPVAWRGPIVMNTEDELDTAYEELEKGIFIR